MSELRSTVILADDHPMLLEGLRKLLEPFLEVVAVVNDGEGLIEAAVRLRPALVIADISMPGMDGVEATRRLRILAPATRVLILSLHDEAPWVQAAFEAGAWAYLSKVAAPDEIERAVQEVLADRYFLSPAVTRALMDIGQTPTALLPQAAPAGQSSITARERDVALLVGKGLTNKEIAHRLGVSITTVRTHLSNVYTKLGCSNRVELAIYATQSAGRGE